MCVCFFFFIYIVLFVFIVFSIVFALYKTSQCAFHTSSRRCTSHLQHTVGRSCWSQLDHAQVGGPKNESISALAFMLPSRLYYLNGLLVTWTRCPTCHSESCYLMDSFCGTRNRIEMRGMAMAWVDLVEVSLVMLKSAAPKRTLFGIGIYVTFWALLLRCPPSDLDKVSNLWFKILLCFAILLLWHVQPHWDDGCLLDLSGHGYEMGRSEG